eukprot:TRINITY_DN22246_c0_g1_i1.p1 TRINITY_DN22246_c0_g1~~TRINITY_DN22246_c0_g1_i1.p1  ORF type:complete len:882 (+),score=90.87 TRINITY_DN22246_c0_g1_i1:82-2727(+)
MGSGSSSASNESKSLDFVDTFTAMTPEEFREQVWDKIPLEQQEPVKAKLSAVLGLGATKAKIAYISDVEGHWPFFCNYVDNSRGLRFANAAADNLTRHTPEDLDIVLEDGWQFIFGGDACDKGLGTLRFLEAMVRLKKKYPNRVTLIMGNRDVNKMRWTAEVATSELELSRVKECPVAFWIPKAQTFLAFITDMAAKQNGIEKDAVNDEMLEKLCTKANKYRYLLNCDMGSFGDFEFRRKELAIIKQKPEEEITDDDVVHSYEQSLEPSGWMASFLDLAQIGAIVGTTLFVHGQVVNGIDEKTAVPSMGVVPGEKLPIEDLRLWIAKLNSWGADQVMQWKTQLTWTKPPTEATLDAWKERGGADLIAYGTPGSPWPTVIYCRYLTKTSMPLPLPTYVTDIMKKHGVFNLVVGHTPHGTAPTVIRARGINVIMADTSFSDMKSNLTFVGDNRGRAVYDICFEGADWSVTGMTEKSEEQVSYDLHPACGDPLLGLLVTEAMSGKEFFFKARLAKRRYLLTHIAGFAYFYAVLHEIDAKEAAKCGKFTAIIQEGSMGKDEAEKFERLTILCDNMRVSKDDAKADSDNTVELSPKDMVSQLSARTVRYELVSLFPNLDVATLCSELTKLTLTDVTAKHLMKCCETSIRTDACVPGIYFPIVEAADGRKDTEFPKSLPSMALVAAEAIRPTDFQIFKEQPEVWRRAGQICKLDVSNAREVHATVLGKGPKTANIWVSALSDITLPAPVRKALGIPDEAIYFTFIYPSRDITLIGLDAETHPDIALLATGGFAYLDAEYDVKRVLALTIKSDGSLCFGPPQFLSHAWVRRQLHLQNFHPVTLPFLVDKGVSDFCWIEPATGSDKNSDDPRCQHGGYAYLGSPQLLDI